jgi:putative glycosyltransferase (TIGR04372 family)
MLCGIYQLNYYNSSKLISSKKTIRARLLLILNKIISLFISIHWFKRFNYLHGIIILFSQLIRSLFKFNNKIQLYILVYNLKSGINIPSLSKCNLSLYYIENHIYDALRFIKHPVSNNNLVNLVLLIEYTENWQKFQNEILKILKIEAESSKQKSWELAYKIFSTVSRFGNHQIGEMILTKHKDHLNISYLDASLYFSAIGHLAQFSWLIHLHELTGEPEKVKISLNRDLIKNSYFANKLLIRIEHLNWEVYENIEQQSFFDKYHDLECVNTKEGNKIIRRYMSSKFSMENSKEMKPVLSFDQNENDLVFSVINKWKIDFDPSEKFVGLHLRSGGEPAAGGRNSSIIKYVEVAEYLNKIGFKVLIIGDETQMKYYKNINHSYWINTIKEQSYEREIIHNYIWSNASFIIGNLSGGTFPAMSYGTPIIWTDFFPIRHYRPPFRNNIVVPKLIADLQGNYINYSDIFLNKNIFNSENLDLLLSNNLMLVENSSIDIINAINDLILINNSLPNYIEGEDSKIISNYYSSIGMPYGANWAPSFLLKYRELIILN